MAVTDAHERRRRTALAMVLAGLSVSRVGTERWLPPAWHVPANVATAGAVLAVAASAGLHRDALGLAVTAPRVRAGLALGGAASAAVAAGIVAVGAVRPSLLRDARAARMSTTDAALAVGWRIPVGTVAPEELAFRGALPALLAGPTRPAWWPAAASSLLFGAWHVLSTDELAGNSPTASEVAGRLGPVATRTIHGGALAVVGMALHALRRRSGSLLAPALVHLTANAVGLLAARRVGRHDA